jgi:hypothetical protein
MNHIYNQLQVMNQIYDLVRYQLYNQIT